MKKIIVHIFTIIVISSCTVRESSNTQIHLENDSQKEALTTENKIEKVITFREGNNGLIQNQVKSFFLFQEAAIQGNIVAQANLAWMYDNGIGIKQNKKSAIYWYTKAADQGSALSQYNLGFIYLLEQNYKDALKWFEKASTQGFIAAWSNLGVMHSQGLGVEKNSEIAFQYFKLSAENGDINGQINLGMLYYEDVKIPRNDIQAYAWFQVAACATGNDRTCLDQVHKLTERMSDKQLNETKNESIKIKRKIEQKMTNHICQIQGC